MSRQKPSNRDQVVAVAADMFLRRGFAQTSMDDVVRESRVSKSNIYYHFASKEDLVLAVLEQRMTLWEREAEKLLTQEDKSVLSRLEEYLRSLADELAGRNCEGGCPFVSLLTQAAPLHEEVRTRIGHFFSGLVDRLTVLIEEGTRRKELRCDLVPRQVALLVLSAAEGAMVLAEAHRSADLVEQSCGLLLELLQPVRSNG